MAHNYAEVARIEKFLMPNIKLKKRPGFDQSFPGSKLSGQALGTNRTAKKDYYAVRNRLARELNINVEDYARARHGDEKHLLDVQLSNIIYHKLQQRAKTIPD